MLRKFTVRALLLLIMSALLLSGLKFVCVPGTAAAADEERFIPKQTTLNITDGEFTSDSNGTLATPSGWSGTSLNKAETEVTSGIISLNGPTFARNKTDLYKLNYYFTGNQIPEKSTSGKLGLNDNVLMINARNNAVAYGYRSSSLTVSPNTFYKISVDVLTADVDKLNIQKGKHDGAFIQITGDIKIASTPIFTNESWQTYYFFIKGHPYKTLNIQLILSLGMVTEDNRSLLSQGFAFFDTVTSVSLTEKQYLREISSGNPNYFFEDSTEQDFKDITSQAVANADFESGLTGWSVIQGNNSNALVEVEDLGTQSIFQGSKALKFASTKTGQGGRMAVRSAEFTIERHKYYQISIWQNDKDLTNGVAQSTFSFYKEGEFDQKTTTTLLSYKSPAGTDSWMGNWKTGSFFVKGSALKDYKAVIELWLGGSPTSTTGTGTVYYDNISIREIMPADYEAYSNSGTVINIPSSLGETPSDYSSLNGKFNEITYDKEILEEGKPFKPQMWDKVITTKEFDVDNTISGVVALDRGNYLMINNTEASAVGYKSGEITIEPNAYQKITVELKTEGIEGAGAYLLLKSDNKIISAYEKIKTQHVFVPYDFYIEGGTFSNTITLEIWLGSDIGSIGGGYPNHTKGVLYVQSVKSTITDSADEFNQNIGKANTRAFSFSVQRFVPEVDTTGISRVMGWTAQNPRPEIPVVSGIVNLTAYGDISGVDLSAVSKEDLDLENNPYALVIASAFNTAYGLKNDFALKYESEKFYKITFKVATIGIPEGKGAVIKLGDRSISGINTEQTDANKLYGNKFEDYTFFVKSGPDNMVSHNIEIWLGQNDNASTRASGAVLLNSISIETITEEEYSKQLAEQDKDTEGKIKNRLVFALVEEPVEEVPPADDITDIAPKSTMELFLIPTILFSVVLLMAIALIVIRRLPLHRLRRAKAKAVTYDRAKTMSKIEKSKTVAQESAATDETAEKEEENVIVLPGKKPVKIVVRKKTRSDETHFDE